MTTTQWIIGLIIALLGGGAMGAIITALVTSYKNRQQPVSYSVEMIRIFRRGKNFPRLARLIVADHTGEEHNEDNLSLARIELTNRGNQDIKEFTFGVTMDGNYRVVDLRMSEPDRHHAMKITADMDKPIINPDFILEPFNRGDKYSVDLYFTYTENPGPIRLSSSHSIRFIDLGTNVDKLVHQYQLMRRITIFMMVIVALSLLMWILLRQFGILLPPSSAPPAATSSPASSSASPHS